MSKVVKYNVWAQIEGVDKHDDVLEGDSYREPHLLGEFKREKDAEAYVDKLDSVLDGGESVRDFLIRWNSALLHLLDWVEGTSRDDRYWWGAVEYFAALFSNSMAARSECLFPPSVDCVVMRLGLGGGPVKERSAAWYENGIWQLYKRSLAKGSGIKPVSRRETRKVTVS